MDIASGASPNAGGLKGIDAGIKLDKVTVTAGGTGYTLCAVNGSYYAPIAGPGGTINVFSGTSCP